MYLDAADAALMRRLEVKHGDAEAEAIWDAVKMHRRHVKPVLDEFERRDRLLRIECGVDDHADAVFEKIVVGLKTKVLRVRNLYETSKSMPLIDKRSVQDFCYVTLVISGVPKKNRYSVPPKKFAPLYKKKREKEPQIWMYGTTRQVAVEDARDNCFA